jgi:hypothetical protein
MRSIGLIGSLAVLAISAPLAAQSNNFRTDDASSSASSIQNQRDRTASRVPPGQLPPAGMCRIWINGVSPGRQPAPTDCRTAVANKPANAQVLWGSQTAFPGIGQLQSQKARAFQTSQTTAQRNGRGRGSDAENNNDGDGGNGSNVNQVYVSRHAATNGAGINASRTQSLDSNKEKGHGNR